MSHPNGHIAPDLATFDHSRHMDETRKNTYRARALRKQAVATTILDSPALATLATHPTEKAWRQVLDQWESAIGNPSSDMDNGIVHHLIHTRDLDELNRQLTRIATAGTRHEGDHR